MVYVIFLSGRLMQQHLFGNSSHGDLRNYLYGYFNTSLGCKKEKQTYMEILFTAGVDRPDDILLVTSNLLQAFAAKAFGKLDELSQKCTTGHKTLDKTDDIGPYSRPYYKRPKFPPDSQTYTKRATKRLSFARIAVRLGIQLLLIFKACDQFLYYFV